MTDKTGAIRTAREVVALLEREGNPKAADSVRAVIQELEYIDGLAKEYHGKLSEYVQHFDQKEEELRQREAQLSARQAAPDGWRLVPVDPVAWTLQSELDAKLTTTNGHLWFSNPVNACWTALYTEQQVLAMLSATPPPPERGPLTDEQIDDIFRSMYGCEPDANAEFSDVCRRVEAAHGIGATNAR